MQTFEMHVDVKCTLMEIDLERVNLRPGGFFESIIYLVGILIGAPEIVERITEAIVARKHTLSCDTQ
jgi:hypothetical protein